MSKVAKMNETSDSTEILLTETYDDVNVHQNLPSTTKNASRIAGGQTMYPISISDLVSPPMLFHKDYEQ